MTITNPWDGHYPHGCHNIIAQLSTDPLDIFADTRREVNCRIVLPYSRLQHSMCYNASTPRNQSFEYPEFCGSKMFTCDCGFPPRHTLSNLSISDVPNLTQRISTACACSMASPFDQFPSRVPLLYPSYAHCQQQYIKNILAIPRLCVARVSKTYTTS